MKNRADSWADSGTLSYRFVRGRHGNASGTASGTIATESRERYSGRWFMLRAFFAICNAILAVALIALLAFGVFVIFAEIYSMWRADGPVVTIVVCALTVAILGGIMQGIIADADQLPPLDGPTKSLPTECAKPKDHP